jgi:NADH dehydrogenase
MPDRELQVVTGAFGNLGGFIASRLLKKGFRVGTLTNSPDRPSPLQGKVEVRPFNFSRPEELTKSLKGASILYNTYWVRFNGPGFSHREAIENSKILFLAAKKAKVRRIVHVSILNPSEGAPYEYFRGKAEVEAALEDSGISHAILRPAVLFGYQNILINNIAWLLRHLPIYGIFGKGDYKIQPIHVEDMADLAIQAGRRTKNEVINAIGPETFTFRELVETLARALGIKRLIINIPPSLGLLGGRILGLLVGDVVITREEIEALMEGLLYVNDKPKGKVKLSQWASENRETLGKNYFHELSRRSRRSLPYY